MNQMVHRVTHVVLLFRIKSYHWSLYHIGPHLYLVAVIRPQAR